MSEGILGRRVQHIRSGKIYETGKQVEVSRGVNVIWLSANKRGVRSGYRSVDQVVRLYRVLP